MRATSRVAILACLSAGLCFRDFISEDVFLETLYNSLTGQKNGKFIKHN